MENQKDYVVRAISSNEPKPLLSNGENYMSFEKAVEITIQYLRSVPDLHEWKNVSPKVREAMRWENQKGDSVVISERLAERINP